jgi:hypothetical protein
VICCSFQTLLLGRPNGVGLAFSSHEAGYTTRSTALSHISCSSGRQCSRAHGPTSLHSCEHSAACVEATMNLMLSTRLRLPHVGVPRTMVSHSLAHHQWHKGMKLWPSRGCEQLCSIQSIQERFPSAAHQQGDSFVQLSQLVVNWCQLVRRCRYAGVQDQSNYYCLACQCSTTFMQISLPLQCFQAANLLPLSSHSSSLSDLSDSYTVQRLRFHDDVK